MSLGIMAIPVGEESKSRDSWKSAATLSRESSFAGARAEKRRPRFTLAARLFHRCASSALFAQTHKRRRAQKH